MSQFTPNYALQTSSKIHQSLTIQVQPQGLNFSFCRFLFTHIIGLVYFNHPSKLGLKRSKDYNWQNVKIQKVFPKRQNFWAFCTRRTKRWVRSRWCDPFANKVLSNIDWIVAHLNGMCMNCESILWATGEMRILDMCQR